MAIGATAVGGLAAIAGLATIVPLWKARTANRAGRFKREGRLMRRAIESPDFDDEFDDEEFLEFLSTLVNELEDEEE